MSAEGDTRVLCKYGEECYQKNPQHHHKFRHPVKRRANDEAENCAKKVKNGETPEAEPCSAVGEERVRDESELIIISKLPDSVETKIKTLFLVDMPEDFYDFYKFCETLPNKPVRKSLSSVGLELVGPFDVLGGNVRDCTKDEALRHYRYYYDPPEFLTVLKGDDSTELHFGYFRDDPSEMPVFVASSCSATDCKITICAGNLFGTLSHHMQHVQKTADPFRKMQIQKIQRALDSWTKSKGVSLDSVTPQIKARRSKILAKTFHGAGLVVPYDKGTAVGYRELTATGTELKQMFKRIDEASSDLEETAHLAKLQPVITCANIANDECDFGASLELGLNMFCYGSPKLHRPALHLLTTAYTLLKRPQFAEIIKAHLQSRVKGPAVNTIS